jgi:putative ABC transport system permease protein
LFTHHLTIALRRLTNRPGDTLCNIGGLAVGFVCCLLSGLYIQNEWAFDRHHERSDRIYRVVGEHTSRTPGPMGPALKQDFPEVEGYLRFRPPDGIWVMRYKDKSFYEKRVYWADASLTDVFTIPLIKGHPKKILEEPGSVVISESMARKYFGEEDPLGKTMDGDNGWIVLKVTGVMKDFPAQSHFHADFFVMAHQSIISTGWDFRQYYTYLLLPSNYDLSDWPEKAAAFAARRMKTNAALDITPYIPRLQPVTDIHLRSHLEKEPANNGNITSLYILATMALLILTIACFNYINLTTARLSHRIKEAGMRNVLGATGRHVIGQFLCEALLTTAMALIIAVILTIPALSLGTALWGTTLSISLATQWPIVLGILTVMLGVVFASGLCSALYFYNLSPIMALRRVGLFDASSGRLRHILVAGQFSITIGILITAFLVSEQLRYIQDKDLGFSAEQVLVLPTGIGQVSPKLPALKRALLQNPRVTHVATGPITLYENIGRLQYVQASTWTAGSDPPFELESFNASADYVDMLSFKLIAGRSFSPVFSVDTARNTAIINRTALNKLGETDPAAAIGREIVYTLGGERTQRTVVGVVEDYHMKSLRSTISPTMLVHGFGGFPLIRIRPEEGRSTIAFIKQTWEAIIPGIPFTYTLLSDDVTAQYHGERKDQNVFGLFAVLACLLVGVGLFGLITFLIERKTKEMGIRKVLGASGLHIGYLISREFILLVLVANVLAWPLAYYGTTGWLNQFAYRIDMGLEVYVWTGLVVAILVVLIVVYHGLKLAGRNPIESIRYE